MAADLRRWYLFLLLIMCTAKFFSNFSMSFRVKFSNENMYSHIRGKICNLLNIFLHVFLGFAPTLILMVSFVE
jgi:hypothetical protein